MCTHTPCSSLTLSSMHSDPANMSPTRAKFFAYDLDFAPISRSVSRAVIFSVVTGESSPDMKRPNAPPRPKPAGSDKSGDTENHSMS